MICGIGSPIIPTATNEVQIMRRFIKCISAIVVSAVMLAASVCPAFAAVSAKMGDTIEVRVSIEGEDHMGSATIQINYDKDKLDFLSDETLDGTGLSNPNEPGELLWAVLFGAHGVNFTNKTDVYSAVFVAKQDIADVDSIINFQVQDAFRITSAGVEETDFNCLSYTVSLEGSGQYVSENPSPADTSSASVDDGTATKIDDPTSSSAASSAVQSPSQNNSSKTSSAASSSKADTKSKSTDTSSKESSKPESKSTDTAADTSNDKSTDTALDTELRKQQDIEEDAFESVPAIRTETQDYVSSSADSKGRFPKGIIIGIAACIIVAAGGIAAIVLKKKK